MHPLNFCLPKVRYFLYMATLTIGNNRGKFLFQIAYDHVSKERRFKEKELKPFRGNMLKDPVNIAHMRCAAGRWFEEKKAANMGLPPAASQSGSPFVPLSSQLGSCMESVPERTDSVGNE